MKKVFDIFFEIVVADGFKAQTIEQSDAAFMRDFAAAIAKIPDDIWVLLPPYATNWYNKLATDINSDKPFDLWAKCEGFVSIHESGKMIPTLPIPPQRGRPKKQEVVKRVAPRYSKFAGALKETRKLVLLHPEWSARIVHKALEEGGYPGMKFGVVSVVVSETKALIEVAKELGYWNEKAAEPIKEEVGQG